MSVWLDCPAAERLGRVSVDSDIDDLWRNHAAERSDPWEDTTRPRRKLSAHDLLLYL
jgi:hypothetical protein